MERAGERESVHFLAKGIAENVRERAIPGKKSKKGLIARTDANNLCQRKLF
jgi:hypothetical protein